MIAFLSRLYELGFGAAFLICSAISLACLRWSIFLAALTSTVVSVAKFSFEITLIAVESIFTSPLLRFLSCVFPLTTRSRPLRDSLHTKPPASITTTVPPAPPLPSAYYAPKHHPQITVALSKTFQSLETALDAAQKKCERLERALARKDDELGHLRYHLAKVEAFHARQQRELNVDRTVCTESISAVRGILETTRQQLSERSLSSKTVIAPTTIDNTSSSSGGGNHHNASSTTITSDAAIVETKTQKLIEDTQWQQRSDSMTRQFVERLSALDSRWREKYSALKSEKHLLEERIKLAESTTDTLSKSAILPIDSTTPICPGENPVPFVVKFDKEEEKQRKKTLKSWRKRERLWAELMTAE